MIYVSSNNAVYLFTLSSSYKLYESKQNRVQRNKRDVLNQFVLGIFVVSHYFKEKLVCSVCFISLLN